MRRISMSLDNSMIIIISFFDESIKRHAKTERRSRRRIGSLPSPNHTRPLRTYSNMSLNVPCQKSSNVPFLGFFSVAESGYKSAGMYPNWRFGRRRTCR